MVSVYFAGWILSCKVNTFRYIIFTEEEIEDLSKLLSMLDPMERLFVTLGSEKESTLHLVVPTLKVTIPIIDYYLVNVMSRRYSASWSPSGMIQVTEDMHLLSSSTVNSQPTLPLFWTWRARTSKSCTMPCRSFLLHTRLLCQENTLDQSRNSWKVNIYKCFLCRNRTDLTYIYWRTCSWACRPEWRPSWCPVHCSRLWALVTAEPCYPSGQQLQSLPLWARF